MAMAVCNFWQWHPLRIPLCSLMFFFFFFFYVSILCYFPFHATALNFNLINITSHVNVIKTSGNASISDQGIQLTTNTSQVAGRAIYSELLHLWDNKSGKQTDFNTYFSFVIDSEGSLNYGDGLAFFLDDSDSSKPTPGGAMGLPIQPLTIRSFSSFVAVEFDTFYDPNIDDPINIPGPHVGIDINSLQSSKSETWYFNITQGIVYEAWISYNSSSANLSVIFTGFANNTRIERSLNYPSTNLSVYLSEWVTIGFSAATGDFFEKHTIKSWQFNSTLLIDEPDHSPALAPTTVIPSLGKKTGAKTKKARVVGLTVGSLVLVGVLALVGFVIWKKSRAKEEDEFAIELSMNNEFEAGTGPKKFSYGQLFRATNHFAEEQKLGDGGFGGVYRGFLRESNSYVAVKRISKGSKQGIKEYTSEVKIISLLRHRNLVQLLGWCHEKRELLLVYEFMENGSLDYHLYKEKNLLTWVMRYKIAQGLASALLYLHEEWEQCVVHRDVKSSNVMLDSNFNAKLGDFGLARLVDHGKDSQTTILAGTRGYMAPECLITGKANKESDVYSFGIVALEIACGRKPIDLEIPESQVKLVEWVWDLYGTDRLLEAAVDPKICPNFVKKEMECLMIVGLWCAHPDLNLRPSIRQAIHVLNFEATLPILPAKMPVPTYLAPPVNASSLVSLTYGCTTVSNSNQVQSSSYSYNTNSSKFSSSSASSSPSASLLYT